MSYLPARLKCDQCGTVTERQGAAEWLNIRDRKDLVGFYAGDKGTDLCSPRCLVNYAIALRADSPSG